MNVMKGVSLMKYLRDPAWGCIWGFIGVAVAILALIVSIVAEFHPQNLWGSLNAQGSGGNTPLPTKIDTIPTRVDTPQVAGSPEANSYPHYLFGSGRLAFFDPLNQEGGSRWFSSVGSKGGACQFSNAAYHVSQQPSSAGYFTWCYAKGIFSDIAFEVQLSIIQGDCGGLAIRADIDKGTLYSFHICSDGTYKLFLVPSDLKPITLKEGNSSTIHTGLGQHNTVAFVASGSTIIVYVNMQQIAQLQDANYTSGSIGLIGDARFNDLTDVAYSNARTWAL
jgi:eukaryotic-like serine/threonine-protein kinase